MFGLMLNLSTFFKIEVCNACKIIKNVRDVSMFLMQRKISAYLTCRIISFFFLNRKLENSKAIKLRLFILAFTRSKGYHN